VETLLGDPSKAKAKLGWKLEHSFEQLVSEMVASDLEIARRDSVIAREGFKTYRHSE
jgi:GDPmannose 4,6-dehydratase